MIEVEDIETFGWEPALRGMRNPLDSWDKADSEFDTSEPVDPEHNSIASVFRPVILGPNDESLMRRLIGQGSPDHCKFRRMLAIYCDVTAPLYWWKEFDTYKVGTVANSCSTMHTIMRREFTVDMFSWEDIESPYWKDSTVRDLNVLMGHYKSYEAGGDHAAAMKWWRELIQKLPSSWNQRRTVMLNYEVMANIYKSRRHHKLQEWCDFIDAMVAELPYPWIFTGEWC